ncbi:hypothetical protein EZV62_018530 [Acer yangbiense]|uniref:Uncharacterized protein n=1 Tax=Acer yangbiense TaxID=1000413 RepID=A0A5C7HJM8_9ROSI|nr:hypothetical protein EZV62_018530 [Acer yangbiense]
MIDQEYDDDQDQRCGERRLTVCSAYRESKPRMSGKSQIYYGIRAGNRDFCFTDCSDECVLIFFEHHEALDAIKAGTYRETESQQLPAMATTSIGYGISEEDKIMYVLSGLGPEYDPFVIHVTSMPNSYSLPEITALLLTHETKIDQHASVEEVNVNMAVNKKSIGGNQTGLEIKAREIITVEEDEAVAEASGITITTTESSVKNDTKWDMLLRDAIIDMISLFRFNSQTCRMQATHLEEWQVVICLLW